MSKAPSSTESSRSRSFTSYSTCRTLNKQRNPRLRNLPPPHGISSCRFHSHTCLDYHPAPRIVRTWGNDQTNHSAQPCGFLPISLPFSGRRWFKIVDTAIQIHRSKSHLANGDLLEKTQSEIGCSSLRIMNDREQCSRRWIGGVTQVSNQFSTPGMKNRISIDDPTRTQRKEGHDGRKKRIQRNKSKHLLRLQGRTDERRMLVVE